MLSCITLCVKFSFFQIVGNYYFGEKRSIVVMDNATTHTSVNVSNSITARGALLVYQAAVSPDMNPIEYCFHQYKSHLKRNNWIYRAQPELAHRRALSSVRRANMVRYYRKVGGIRMPMEDDADDREEETILTLCCLTLLAD